MVKHRGQRRGLGRMLLALLFGMLLMATTVISPSIASATEGDAQAAPSKASTATAEPKVEETAPAPAPTPEVKPAPVVAKDKAPAPDPKPTPTADKAPVASPAPAKTAEKPASSEEPAKKADEKAATPKPTKQTKSTSSEKPAKKAKKAKSDSKPVAKAVQNTDPVISVSFAAPCTLTVSNSNGSTDHDTSYDVLQGSAVVIGGGIFTDLTIANEDDQIDTYVITDLDEPIIANGGALVVVLSGTNTELARTAGDATINADCAGDDGSTDPTVPTFQDVSVDQDGEGGYTVTSPSGNPEVGVLPAGSDDPFFLDGGTTSDPQTAPCGTKVMVYDPEAVDFETGEPQDAYRQYFTVQCDTTPPCVKANKSTLAYTFARTTLTVTVKDGKSLCDDFAFNASRWSYDAPSSQWPQTFADKGVATLEANKPGASATATVSDGCGQFDAYIGEGPSDGDTLTGPNQPYNEVFINTKASGTDTPYTADEPASCEVVPPPVVVTPADVTSSDVCGTDNDTYTIPSSEGIEYKVDGKVVKADTYPATGTVNVVATAKDGSVLKEGATAKWTLDFTNEACPPDNFIETSNEVRCGAVDITLHNASPWIYPVSVEVDGVHSYGPTVDNRGDAPNDQTKTRTIAFDEDSGPHTVRYRVDAGTESDLYRDLPVGEWTELTVNSDCEPEVVISPSAAVEVKCDGTGTVTFDNTKSTVSYSFEVVINNVPKLYPPVAAGEEEQVSISGANPGSQVIVQDDTGPLATATVPDSCDDTTPPVDDTTPPTGHTGDKTPVPDNNIVVKVVTKSPVTVTPLKTTQKTAKVDTSNGALPNTGGPSAELLLMSIVLMASGIGFVFVSRRRKNA